MENKKYCFVIELKEEHVEEYKQIHKNPWPEILNAIKSTKVKELIIWIYKNFSIVYYECDNINRVYQELGKLDIVKRWNTATGSWFKESPALNGSKNVATLEKIFDLNQHIAGKLEQY